MNYNGRLDLNLERLRHKHNSVVERARGIKLYFRFKNINL
jgi:hypothetical protein